MKKIFKAAMCAALAAVMLLGVTACTEWTPNGAGPTKTNGQGVGIGLGSSDCIVEATVIVDGYGNPTKVHFDEIFPIADVAKNTAMDSKKACPTVTVSGTEYFQYYHIGDKYFETDATTGKIKEIGGGIEDLAATCKTAEGIDFYYQSFIASKMKVCKVDEANGVEIGGVKLADALSFNTSNGSMRKRYSKYWSSNSYLGSSYLGFSGNMDALENYLITYGFGKISDVKLPGENDTKKYNIIGGITTGATLSGDTKLYLNAAKNGYDKALANQKDL